MGGLFPTGTEIMSKVCAQAGCRNITKTRNCPKCQAAFDMKSKEYAKKRARKSKVNMSNTHKAFYGSAAWRNLRNAKLKKDPLCQVCLPKGYLNEGKDIDHIVEVKDDYSRRLDITNLQTLCRSCHMFKTHSERKQREKSVGRME